MEKLDEILKFILGRKNIPTVAIFAMVIYLAVYFGMQILMPMNADLQSISADIETKKTELETLKKQKEKNDREARKNLIKIEKVPVKIYKSNTPGLSTESASIDLVTTVLKMIENTDNTILDISYKINALSDNEKAQLPSGVSVVQLILSLNGTYTSILDLISALYDYDYLATIKSMKLVPLKENKNFLETNLVIWLYIYT